MTQRNEKRDVRPVVWVVAVIGAWLASPWVVKWVVTTWHVDFEEFGIFGDSFGALTSLFTGLAFVGLIITLRQQKAQLEMQREDLKLQRDEMKAARDELSGQKEQMALQNQSLKQQMFEQTFFNLLNVFNQYIADLVQDKVRKGQEAKTGRDQLQHVLSRLAGASRDVSTGREVRDKFGGIIKEFRRRTDDEFARALAEAVLNGYAGSADDLNSYFRLLYNLLKFIDRYGGKEKKVYTDILRAQLSDSELKLIALNCSRRDGENLQVYVQNYNILKHLPPKLKDVSIQLICDEIRRLEAEGRQSS